LSSRGIELTGCLCLFHGADFFLPSMPVMGETSRRSLPCAPKRKRRATSANGTERLSNRLWWALCGPSRRSLQFTNVLWSTCRTASRKLLVHIEPLARYRPHAILAIRDNAYLSFRASPPLSCYRLNVLFGKAILVPDDREHFALLSVRLDPPRDDLQTGAVCRTATFDESSVDANDHLLRRLIGFAILGDAPPNLFVDALSNRDDPASGGGMGSSTHLWEKHSQQSRGLAIRNLSSQAHLQMTQLGRRSTREDVRNRVPNLRPAAALTISISGHPQTHGSQDGIQAVYSGSL
jgi:hypothetical protein